MLPVDSMIGAINTCVERRERTLQLARESCAQTGLDKICQLSVRFHDGHRLFSSVSRFFVSISRFRFKSQFASFVNTVYREVRLPKIILNDDEKPPTYPKEQEEGEKE